jgi:stage II sporulation protein D
LQGKGYGHGVGLSQEGAIKMVKLGYSYIDILRFYYNNVNVVKYTEIIDFQ